MPWFIPILSPQPRWWAIEAPWPSWVLLQPSDWLKSDSSGLSLVRIKLGLWQHLKWDDGTPSCRNSLSHNVVTVTANQNQGLGQLTNHRPGLHPPSKVIDWRAQTWARVSPGLSHDQHRQAWRVFIQSSEILIQSKSRKFSLKLFQMWNVSLHLMGYL